MMQANTQTILPFAYASMLEGEVVSAGEGDRLGAERKLKPEGFKK